MSCWQCVVCLLLIVSTTEHEYRDGVEDMNISDNGGNIHGLLMPRLVVCGGVNINCMGGSTCVVERLWSFDQSSRVIIVWQISTV